ncbi:MAG: hypothetical protein IK093_10815, partial [Ruminiclostridium sp.]|nr:hypothetical protein [Ruminiclostridium sp.]
RLMLNLIDVDTEYEMKERVEKRRTGDNSVLSVGEYRSSVSEGILITGFMTTLRMSVSSYDEAAGIAPVPSMILFDALDGIVHTDEREIKERLYFEYGEIWFDGRTMTGGARKMQSKVENTGADDIKNNGEYKIEAVRINDHALIRISGKNHTAQVTVALPDSTRFMYISLTGEHCRISDLRYVRSETVYPADFIPRIAEKISYIDAPEGDIPNVQIDGYRTASSEGVEIRNGLTLTFHTKCLPTARLVWHCPFIFMYFSEDGKVNGNHYRELAFMRFDGEFWNNDNSCYTQIDIKKTAAFGDWDTWMKRNMEGYDVSVSFAVEGNKITVITENAGIAIRNTAVISGTTKPVYAAITGDQIAVTNIKRTYS